MGAVFTWAVACVLLPLLAAPARGDMVAPARCLPSRYRDVRLRRYPVDGDATWLSMDYCNLNQTDFSDATGLPKLVDISLTNNENIDINLTTLNSVPQLKHLYITYNDLRDAPVFPDHSCPNLTLLWMHNNKITAITDSRTFSACIRLNQLSLQRNRIEYLHPDVFSSLTFLNMLYLRDNKIRYISDRLFSRNVNLDYLYLENNRFTHLPADFVAGFKFRGRGIYALYVSGNPFHCACLLELLADLKKAPVYNYIDYPGIYRGQYPECHMTGRAACCRQAPTGLLRRSERDN